MVHFPSFCQTRPRWTGTKKPPFARPTRPAQPWVCRSRPRRTIYADLACPACFMAYRGTANGSPFTRCPTAIGFGTPCLLFPTPRSRSRHRGSKRNKKQILKAYDYGHKPRPNWVSPFNCGAEANWELLPVRGEARATGEHRPAYWLKGYSLLLPPTCSRNEPAAPHKSSRKSTPTVMMITPTMD